MGGGGIVMEFRGGIRRGNIKYGISLRGIITYKVYFVVASVVFEHKTSIAIFIHHAYY